MRWSVSRKDPRRQGVDVCIVGVLQRDKQAVPDGWADLARGAAPLRRLLARGGFTAALEQTWPVPADGDGGPRWWLPVGLGPAGETAPQDLRRAAAAAVRRARELRARRVALLMPWSRLGRPAAAARCVVEGAELGLFDPGLCRGAGAEPPPPAPRAAALLAGGEATARALRDGAAAGEALAAGTLLARRLATLPANLLGPRELVGEARRLGREVGLAVRAAGAAELRRRGMGGILGVARGSRRPPYLITAVWEPPRSRRVPTVVLVGKGVTFDTGGISLKPGKDMHEMKGDMGGAAAVLGALRIVAALRLPARVVGLIPAVENMPDGDALRPGDVLTMANGKTVEVLNTDAEGRLILADALVEAGRHRPDFIIDAATLTGACAVALGQEFAGVMTNDGALGRLLEQAGGETFERVWRLPLVESHREAVKGTLADLKNIAGREAGASTAAAFLQAFVPEGVPWAHLDIAGPAWAAAATSLAPQGPTGFGARLLARAVALLAGAA